jgi:hypothetical protein
MRALRRHIASDTCGGGGGGDAGCLVTVEDLRTAFADAHPSLRDFKVTHPQKTWQD